MATEGSGRVITTVMDAKPRCRGAPSVVESETAVQSVTAICRPGARTRVANRGETRFDPFRRVSLDVTLPLESTPCLSRSSHSHRRRPASLDHYRVLGWCSRSILFVIQFCIYGKIRFLNIRKTWNKERRTDIFINFVIIIGIKEASNYVLNID